MRDTKEDYLDVVKAQIEHAYSCPAYYLRTEAVVEAIEENVIWQGEVEVFGLIGHSQAKRCFAWGHAYDRSALDGKIVIALEILPTVSPQNAVRAQLANDLRATDM